MTNFGKISDAVFEEGQDFCKIFDPLNDFYTATFISF